MLIIDDFGELLALNKLLRTVRFSASLDSEDIEQFAGSPLIASLAQKANEEFLRRWSQEYPSAEESLTAQQQVNWLNQVLEAIEQRVSEWPEDKVLTVRQWDRAQVTELSEVYLTATEYSDTALNRLVAFIMHRVRPGSAG